MVSASSTFTLLLVLLPLTTATARHHIIKGSPLAAENVDCEDCEKEKSNSNATSAISAQQATNPSLHHAINTCGLYMAESTIENGGLGIFTVLPKKRGELLGWGGDPVVPLTHTNALLRDYTWSPKLLGLQSSSATEAFAPGLESLLNCHTAAVNAGPVIVETTTGTQLHTAALTSIPEGGEIYGYYGDHWFQGRHEYADMVLTEDYETAEQITLRMRDTCSKISGPDADDGMKTQVKEDLWNLVKDWKLVDEPKVWKALPQSLEAMEQVAMNSMSAFHQDLSAKSITDLAHDSSARCVDSIRATDKGAFAARSFSVGQVITGSPLLHVGEDAPKEMLKYCYGHPESSLTLCPYAPGVTSIQHGKEANVMVQWAGNGHLHHQSAFLESEIDEILEHQKPVLAVDYIALADIKKGDELIIDFGLREKAKHAFLEHASYWNHPTAVGAIILRTEGEQVDNPYPPTVALRCHKAVLYDQTHDIHGEVKWTDDNSLPCEITDRYIDPVDAYVSYAVKILDGYWTGRAGVPRRYIRFVDVAEQPIALRLNIFPKVWLNKAVDSSNAGEDQEADEELTR